MNKEKLEGLYELFYACLFQLNLDDRYGHLVDNTKLINFLKESFVEFLSDEKIEQLMFSLKKHDETTFLHSFDVMILAGIITYQTESKNLSFMRGAFLHDIGKLLVPKGILQKRGKPTTEEFNAIKLHTTLGCNILYELDFHYESKLARSHHERLNGKGYPDGLTAKEIDYEVRLLGILDVYSALTLERPYKRAFTNKEAFEIMIQEEGNYDKELLDGFMIKIDRNCHKTY